VHRRFRVSKRYPLPSGLPRPRRLPTHVCLLRPWSGHFVLILTVHAPDFIDSSHASAKTVSNALGELECLRKHYRTTRVALVNVGTRKGPHERRCAQGPRADAEAPGFP
jgi:hypothetical protein